MTGAMRGAVPSGIIGAANGGPMGLVPGMAGTEETATGVVVPRDVAISDDAATPEMPRPAAANGDCSGDDWTGADAVDMANGFDDSTTSAGGPIDTTGN